MGKMLTIVGKYAYINFTLSKGYPMKRLNRPWSKSTRQKSSNSLRLVLEPRMVFDGAMATTAAEVQQDSVDDKHDTAVDSAAATETEHNGDFALAIDTQPNADAAKDPAEFAAQPELPVSPVIDAAHEPSPIIIVVDARDENAASLRAHPPEDAQIVTIDSGSDGFQQISELLQTRTDVSELHVLPWTDGQTQWLGNKPLTAALEPSTGAALMHWGDSFDRQGEVVFHGQSPASSGWLNQVSALTGVQTDWSQDDLAALNVDSAVNTPATSLFILDNSSSAYADILNTAQQAVQNRLSEWFQRQDYLTQVAIPFNANSASSEWVGNALNLQDSIVDGRYSIHLEVRSNAELNGVFRLPPVSAHLLMLAWHKRPPSSPIKFLSTFS